MQIHNPDIYGALSVAGSAGSAGQRLTSGGAGAAPTWETDSTALKHFSYSGASATSHVIAHNLGLTNKWPNITVYNQADDAVLQPATVVATDANTVTVTLAVARAIRAIIIGL